MFKCQEGKKPKKTNLAHSKQILFHRALKNWIYFKNPKF